MLGFGLLLFVVFGYVCWVGFLFWRGLGNTHKSDWALVITGIVLLAVACACVGSSALVGGLGVAIAFLIGLPATVAAVLTGTILVVKVRGKRRYFGLLLGLGFPVALFLSIQIGDRNSPESVRQANGTIVAQALDQYRADHGRYPAMLNELTPEYLTDLREPGTIWGWLYQADENEFSLGFVDHVDRDGYSIYLYRSDTDKWEYLPPYSARTSFDLPPTPMP